MFLRDHSGHQPHSGLTALFTKLLDCLPPTRMLSRDCSCQQLPFTANGHFSFSLKWYQSELDNQEITSFVNSALKGISGIVPVKAME